MTHAAQQGWSAGWTAGAANFLGLKAIPLTGDLYLDPDDFVWLAVHAVIRQWVPVHSCQMLTKVRHKFLTETHMPSARLELSRCLNLASLLSTRLVGGVVCECRCHC